MLISPKYLEQQKAMHAKGDYGIVGHKLANHVGSIWQGLGQPKVLDYGCGQATLSNALPHIAFDLYDPAIERFSKKPDSQYKLVTCTDVFEHLEPACVDDVLKHIASLIEQGGGLFMEVAEGPAMKNLPDGRNAHLIQQGMGWWIARMEKETSLRVMRAERSTHGFIGFAIIPVAPTPNGKD